MLGKPWGTNLMRQTKDNPGADGIVGSLTALQLERQSMTSGKIR